MSCIMPLLSVFAVRWETEEWVHRLLPMLKEDESASLHILDICTGTGCIALSLAAHLKNANIFATDVSEDAIALAKHNQDIHASKLKSTVDFKLLDIFDDAMSTMGPFDLIVSNPLYYTGRVFKS